MLKKIIIVCLAFLFLNEISAQIKWPTITKTNKPWTRWWWEGSAVNKKDLTWNLEQYQKAGLGGVEITPIYGVYGYEKQFIDFLSPHWMQMLVHTLNESKRLGMGVDLANGTGWPFGGPWVKDADASKTIYWKTYSLSAGEQLNESIEYKQEALVRTANNKPASVDSILNPLSKNKNLQALALDQIQFPGKLLLKSLMAFSDNGSRVDLTSKVDANGKLNWIAGNGKWTLYALFEGLHGKMVERAAPGGEGYAIDHFSANAARNYFKRFDEAFKGYDLSYLRGFFNDSYEVDDARGQGNWTNDLLDQFKKRKGYDLRDYLPAFTGKDNTDMNSRVIYDYRSVIDELILENFTKEWKKWGASKGKILRNQSHGSPANTLDLYSVVDIPETEGTDILRFKFATSAANVTGKKLVSSESATWLNEHFLSSWADVKKAVDLYFLGGVNHIFYHGTAYSPKDTPWPGWLFYAAVHFQPVNPQWKDFHVLNQYITRVQSFLQNSKPDNDVLLYYPIADRYSEPGNALLQHFDGMERNFEKTDFEHVSKWMLENGIGFDFFSDRQLENFTSSNGLILTGGNTYKVILLPGNKLVPEKTMEKIVALAKQGATIIVYNHMPEDVPGFGQLEDRRKIFQQSLNQLQWNKDTSFKKATIGKGDFFVSKDLGILLAIAGGVDGDVMQEKKLSVLRRKNNDGLIFFINNRTDQYVDRDVILEAKAKSVGIFDPMTGKAGLGKLGRDNEGHIYVRLQLRPYESVIVQAYQQSRTGSKYPYPGIVGDTKKIQGNWTIEFLEGGPTIPSKITTDKLVSWTELGGDEMKNFSGIAKYSITFQRPEQKATSYLLDLGKVNETAEVILNGKKIETLIGPVFECVIPASAFQQNNKLEIIVANLMANRIAYMDKNNLTWKIFYNTNMPARKRENVKNGLFDASSWAPLPSGLSGPVTLTPLANE